MRIEVYKGWIIRSNPGDKGFTVCKSAGTVTRTNDKGEEVESEVYKQETYPATIEGCLRAICRQEQINSKATSWEEFMKEIKKQNARLEDIGRKLG